MLETPEKIPAVISASYDEIAARIARRIGEILRARRAAGGARCSGWRPAPRPSASIAS